MGNILVMYCSKTGNTEKMAELVAAGARSVEGTEVRARTPDTAELADLEWCDGIALGAPTNLGGVPWRMKKWWDEEATKAWARVDGKIGTVFSTSGGWGGGSEVTCMGLYTLLMNFGFLVFGVTDYVGKQFTLHYGAVTAGAPRSESEQESCRRLGRRLAEWVALYIDRKEIPHPTSPDYKRLPEDFS